MLIDVVQNPSYHPEGDVFEHTMQALDAAVFLEYRNEDEKLMIMVAALCHDFGKSVCTTPDGKSYGHAQAGIPLATTFISRLTSEQALRNAVAKLVEYHLMPGQLLDQNSSLRAYKRLASKLAPNVSLHHLSLLALCDMRGRNCASHEPLTEDIPDIQQFLEKAKKAHVMHEKEKPILLGRDFLEQVSVGKEIGILVKRAYELQIDEHIADREELFRRVMDEYLKHQN
jgi:tRNA nucleotidyltransferase (CCA-adding enzyme)